MRQFEFNRQSILFFYSANETLFEKYVFKTVKLSGKFPSHNRTLIMPVTLTTSMLPVQIEDTLFSVGTEYTAEDNNETTTWKDASIKLNGRLSNILTFAIHQRDYSKDSEIQPENLVAPSAGHNIQISLGLIANLLLALLHILPTI